MQLLRVLTTDFGLPPSPSPADKPKRRFRFKRITLLAVVALPVAGIAMVLLPEPATAFCGTPALPEPNAPATAAQRLAGSKVAPGQLDIAWAWLGTPTDRYPHTALGSRTHAGSLHVLVAPPGP